MRAVLALVLACLVALVGGPARAHTGSYDMKYVDGSNLILLTFNTHQPTSGLDIVHDIRLYDLVGAPIPYDEVRVEVHTRKNTDKLAVGGDSLIEEDTLPMLATNESKLTYAYPISGSYTLSTEFLAGGRPISRGEFAIEITPGAAESSSGYGPLPLVAAFAGGAAVALVVTALVRRRRSREVGDVEDSPDPDDAVVPEEQEHAFAAGRGNWP
ncbi:hypothetical protein ASC77_00020 [Nocardioides sp. Root1257]|uniref:hypothetical protein n=1 Tax=unclassified Nocardioides TaxID=2615069 RepID=UPI0006FDF2A6|nr:MULTISPECIES: hypothetical protein [unclassified Nocardioides]KQW52749.1 hypothetical protein ASC77_00020 [Nocardioides sp. Root1257]KRC55437.1 hypothetical protein ASE24_00020 [Nocardioides sp. Root224]